MDDHRNGAKAMAKLSTCSFWPIFGPVKQVAKVRPLPPVTTHEPEIQLSPDFLKKEALELFKNYHVPCLMSMAVLSPLCVSASLKFNPDPCHLDRKDPKRLLPLGEGVYQEEFEIEEIMDHREQEGDCMYLIKWKDWDHEFNTWEPKKNLEHSHKILNAYEKKVEEIKRLKRKHGPNYHSFMEKQKKLVEIIQQAYSHKDIATLLKLSGKSPNEFSDTKTETKNMADGLLDIVKTYHKTKYKNPTNVLVINLLNSESKISQEFLDFTSKRLEILESLKQWETHINGLSGEREAVTVENHIDLEGPPTNFTYITDYKPSPGIFINEDPPIGCDCGNACYDNRRDCCAALSGSHFAYNRSGTLMIPQGTPLYECNKRCSCDSSCPNRVVQKGRPFKLSIFRTHNERGWGIKTMERIKKGSFVMEYVGEVITSDEAEKRGRVYDEEGRTYLFDLDFDVDGQSVYTVDAARYGNVAHFMNHSCDPNLVVYVVWINNLDQNLPRIAFFSKHDIKKGEELTFDYKMSATSTGEATSPSSNFSTCRLGSPSTVVFNPDSLEPQSVKRRRLEKDTDSEAEGADTMDSPFIQKRRIPCKCGMEKCRKYLF